MRFSPSFFLFFSGLVAASLSAQAQQPAPAPTVAAPVPLPSLSEDSVRVMTGLVQTSVRQLHNIYFEPNDARAVQLIEAALVEMPALNKRLSFYTASLPREQQHLLAQRLRQQPWQVELQTLQRSPQYHDFNTRADKNPALKTAFDRLQAAGFMGTAKPAVAAANPAAPTAVPAAKAVAAPVVATPAPIKASAAILSAQKPSAAVAAAAKAQQPAPAKPAAAAVVVAKPVAISAPGPKPVTSKAAPGKAPAAAHEVAAKPAVIKTEVVTVTAPVASAPQMKRHTVVKGETLFGICRQYHVKPAQMRAWNHKKEDGVRIGEVLQVQVAQ
ncbi:LysM peptidoglycan-binding domain-containing protein [Hymenobacter sp. DG25A]|uniref:LysM peptidoglycan-binding domain-containing protein n=1 Tax=Hymenobacter sp. DG25A TaxID=1385663 RepID=UPI0006C8E0A7|nr:LysM peptidoglycan-binding domain-containing protein [Hymenobacter sp. DG25A]